MIVVGWSAGPGAAEAKADGEAAEAAATAEVERLVESGVARGEAARRVSATSGIPRRRLYNAP